MIHLVTGGARSGKSSFVLRDVPPGPVAFIATAQAFDGEMAARIAAHRAERGPRFRTIEAPVALAAALASADEPAVIVDCLTVWVSNLLLGDHDVDAAVTEVSAALAAHRADVWLVTNEVGMGIVPDNALARLYRDALGRCNQRLAAEADRVTLLACGLPLRLK